MKEKIIVETYDMLTEIEKYFVKPNVNKTFWIIVVLCLINIVISFCIVSIILELIGLMVLSALIQSREESYMKSKKTQLDKLDDFLEYDVEVTENEIKYVNARNNIENITEYNEITHYVETENYLVIFDKEWQYLAIPIESELVEKLKKKLTNAKKINWILYW